MNFAPFSFYVQKQAPAIPAVPVTQDLILNLDVANASSYTPGGNTWTDTIGGKIFNLYGSPTYDASKYSLAFLTAGTQYARWAQTVTPANFPIWNGFTMEGWVNFPTGGSFVFLFAPWLAIPQNPSYFKLGADSSPALKGAVLNTTRTITWYAPTTTNNIGLNVWRQIALVWDKTAQTLQMYNNGTTFNAVTTGVTDMNTTTGTGAGLAMFRDGNISSTGTTGILRVYSRALSAAEIAQNYSANKSRFGLIN